MTEVLPNKANRIVPTGMLIEDEVATPAEESIGFSVKLKPLTTRFLDVHDQSNPVTPSNRMIRQQTRSSLGSQSNSTNNVNVALVNISVETLINYLTTNIETVGSDDFITKQFEELTCEVLQNNHDPELNRIVKNHGWTGSRYRPPNEGQLDAAACLQEFSNWYLKHKVSSYTSHISNLFGLGDSKGADQILSFCPDTLLKFLRDKPFDHTAMIDVRCLTFVGACMLADISGFSKFSGAMCSKGVSGLDDLREATNGFLGHVVKIVYEFDGDVIAFAGDALICVFPEDQPVEEVKEDVALDGGIESNDLDCCFRAIQCACALSKHQTKHLSAHIGVSYGEMKLALLGGVNHQWVYLMNGACVTELAGCINDAGPTEVAVTPDCYNHALACIEQSSDPALNVTLDVNQLKSRNYLVQGIKYKSAERAFRSARSRRMSILKHDNSRYISLDKSNEQALIESAALFVPRPILTAVYSESLDHIAELRQVTTMFLSLDSYSPSLHQDPATLQGFFFAAQQVLFESGGFLRQFLVDDKGCVLIAMWGMPSFTYSNNCSRALFTAVMILNQSKELGHKCSAGVTTGTVFCGSVGAPERRDYAAIGNEVNMAARLMGKAKGRVLIDNNTYQNLNGATRNKLHAAEEMKLKGNDTPVKPYEYTDLGEIPRITQDDEQAKYATILRRQVKAILMDQLDRLANSKQYSDDDQKTSFSIILGLPGTGKSTAAEYFRRGARRRNLQCVFIQARPGHDGVPYGLMRELFLEVVGEDNFQTEAQQRAVIGDLINQAYSDDYERLNAKLSVELVLGVEWSEVYNRFDASDYSTMLKSEKVSSPKSAFASVYSDEEEFSSGMKESYSTKNDPYTDSRSALKRRTGDLAFYKILCVLLKNTPTAIIFEDAHFCDELSWNEMHLLLIGNEISLAILLTMRSSTSVKFPSSSNGDGNPFQSTEKASTPVSGNRRQSILTSNNGRSNSMLGSSSMDNQDNPGIFSHASKYGLRFQSCPAYMSIMGHDNSCVIEMTGLNEEEVTDVLIRTLEVSTVSSDLVKLVLDVSSGNAFWCKAIAKFIHERGVKELEKAIEQGDSRQDSLKVLIVCRMEKLSVEEQLVLKHASILGDEFSETMLTAVLPSKLHSNLSQSLEQLAEHGFILCIEEHPVAIFVFQNQLIQRTLYSLMPPSDAAHIHCAVAEFIEKEYALNLRPFYPSLGHHYKCSIGKRALAFKYKVKSADQAISRGAYNDGLIFAQAASTLGVSKPELRVLLDVISRALHDISQTTRLNHSVRRNIARSFSCDFDQTNGRVAQYLQLKISTEAALEKMTKGNKITEESAKNRMVISRQPSAKLTWQASYVASKMDNDSEADDDDPVQEDKPYCCVLS